MSNIFLWLFLLCVSMQQANQAPVELFGTDTSQDSISCEISSFSERHWVDSVFSTLSNDEKIAQLIFIKAFSNRDDKYADSVAATIKRFGPGGVIFFKGSPSKQVKLCNSFQLKSKVPLFIALDGEWGLAMRLDSIIAFPKQMTLGAVTDNNLIYKMGIEIARQFKRMGIHINFAPVADINSNPRNPVINYRSFGESRESVAMKSTEYMLGMQKNNIMAVGKHFPGHGDTDQDSHHTLPIINHDRKTLEETDLYPFKKLIRKGIDGIMVAHLNVPALDTASGLPSTLSCPVITDLLKMQLGFSGLVFTDAMEMKGVSNYNDKIPAEVKALLAGNDILLMPLNIQKTISSVRNAIDSGLIMQSTIDEKCLKILHFKYKYRLNELKPVSDKELIQDLQTPESELLARQLYESAMTLLVNKNKIIPLTHLDTLRIACLVAGDTVRHPFQDRLDNYASIKHFNVIPDSSSSCTNDLLAQLDSFNLIITAIVNTHASSERNYNISPYTINLINTLKKSKKMILDIFANPYALSMLDDTSNISALLVSYEDKKLPADISAQLIFGGVPAKGKLPVTVSASFPIGSGLQTKQVRLKYTIPEDAGISSSDLHGIDSIAMNGIREKAYPGCRVLAAVNGKIIYDKSFGYLTYDSSARVCEKTIYDIASITKITASTLAMMNLYQEKKIGLDVYMSEYLPFLKKTDKEPITIRQVMAHQAGLSPTIQLYQNMVKNKRPETEIYSNVKTGHYSIPLSDSMFISQTYQDTALKYIAESALLKKNEYKYSDLGFVMLKFLVENATGNDFEKYLEENFYKPLGLAYMGFHPLKRFPRSIIAPTEIDQYFRMQTVRGYVHDPTAAILGGVAGHAGLFSDAGNLAVIMQMLLQKGTYGGRRYFSEQTVNEFTRTQFIYYKNRRGLGFDKPVLDKNEEGPTCRSASLKSFGHTGFTGTYAWADPENNLVYIFLSNRTWPDGSENKLAKLNIRTKIQQVLYDAVGKVKNP